MVRAQVIARDPSGSGNVCWKCMRNGTRCVDFERWKVRSSVNCLGSSKGAKTSSIEAAAADGAVETCCLVDERVALYDSLHVVRTCREGVGVILLFAFCAQVAA